MTLSLLQKSMVLTVGQGFGFFFQLLLPVFLSRYLEIEEYGTFRQIVLMQWAMFFVLNLGLENTLFFFAKKDPDRFDSYSLTTIAISILMALLAAAGLSLFRYEIASLLQNDELANYLPLFGVYLVCALPNQQLDQYLVIKNRIYGAAMFNFIQVAINASIAIAGYYFWQSLTAVLWMMICYESLKSVALMVFTITKREVFSNLSIALVRNQFAVSFPIAVSNFTQVLLYFDRFLISAMFSVKQFTIYSIGCFDVPVLHSFVTNLSDVMSIEAVANAKANDYGKAKDVWMQSMRQIVLIVVPVLSFLFIFSDDLIVLVFSPKYAESSQYFQVFLMITFVSYLDPELMFRALNMNQASMKTQIVSLVLNIFAIVVGAKAIGPMGALYGKLAANLCVLVWRAHLISMPLEFRLRNVYPIALVLRMLLILASVGIMIRLLVESVAPSSLYMRLLSASSLYGVAAFILIYMFAGLKDSEKKYLMRTLGRLVPGRG